MCLQQMREILPQNVDLQVQDWPQSCFLLPVQKFRFQDGDSRALNQVAAQAQKPDCCAWGSLEQPQTFQGVERAKGGRELPYAGLCSTKYMWAFFASFLSLLLLQEGGLVVG